MSRRIAMCCVVFLCVHSLTASDLTLEVTQLTHGPKHHFFGYIGQSLTTPWNKSGRYILTLRTSFHDRMPEPADAAEICWIDTADGNRVIPIESTRAWNFQQGTMFYWHPLRAETQFFFNDRDPDSQEIFTVLYDIQQRRRVKEFRFSDVPVANGGVSPTGKFFLAINYGRMARLRPVTGYPGAADPTANELAPGDDGIFRVDTATGQRKLLVSFLQLRDLLHDDVENINEMGFYINHSLSSRDGKYVYFYARARYGSRAMAIDTPCSMRSDGTQLKAHPYIGGHPDWGEAAVVIGAQGDRQVRYDVNRGRIVGEIGKAGDFPTPGGDIAFGPQGAWFANGFSTSGRAKNEYVIMRLSDGKTVHSRKFSRGPYQRGELRIDPAPRWNRDGSAILVPEFTADGTRQLCLIRIRASGT